MTFFLQSLISLTRFRWRSISKLIVHHFKKRFTGLVTGLFFHKTPFLLSISFQPICIL